MKCACISAGSVDDPVFLLKNEIVTARKEHVCCECRRKILPKEKYLKEVAVYDGGFSTYKTCTDCQSVREYLVCDFYYEMVWDLVHDFVIEDADDLPYAKIGKLTKAAREKVCEIIEQRWESEEDVEKRWG